MERCKNLGSLTFFLRYASNYFGTRLSKAHSASSCFSSWIPLGVHCQWATAVGYSSALVELGDEWCSLVFYVLAFLPSFHPSILSSFLPSFRFFSFSLSPCFSLFLSFSLQISRALQTELSLGWSAFIVQELHTRKQEQTSKWLNTIQPTCTLPVSSLSSSSILVPLGTCYPYTLPDPEPYCLTSRGHTQAILPPRSGQAETAEGHCGRQRINP